VVPGTSSGLIVLGLIVGLIARLIVPGKQPMGWVATALLGILGSYVGGTLGSNCLPAAPVRHSPPIQHAFLGALVGAVILLWIFKVATSRTKGL